MAQQYDKDPAKRDLQIEAKVHIELERDLDRKIDTGNVRPTAPDFIQSIQLRFYAKLPERFKTFLRVDCLVSDTVRTGYLL
jgi:hypothetical protein